jgi:purine-cytosine permease-like protein
MILHFGLVGIVTKIMNFLFGITLLGWFVSMELMATIHLKGTT